ncbi:MAG: L-threonylcarbamoyladenylate synthase [Aestuariivita sp.]|nr:L-threonylcarbamoyladenylate synthase [Aestuariivita sp.]MCY4201749.1 L-threonylcarbamoyladenylate synthase [Aestuariivita sp.]MCY4289427.1 L-threonylcarbamoyladenylate synthase [Aestuariivita sp.]MCY4346652.1 L-threonylcarbamoyladenylate synthase [Aestuariivita sp.]
MKTQRLTSSRRDIAHAADLLRGGKLVAFPTETVYGLGADVTNDQAVSRIYSVKNRPSFNPLIVHVYVKNAAVDFVEFNPAAELLADRFWPGPLTLLLPQKKSAHISQRVASQSSTVGIRVPSHPVAQSLLQAFGGAVAAPSANLSGCLSPTTVEHVLSGLSNRIDAVVDGGPCRVGIESTIIGFKDNRAIIVRHGGIALDTLEAALNADLTANEKLPASIAPGQLPRHYAPDCPLRINARERRSGEVYLGFGSQDGDRNLSPNGNLTEASSHLFAELHALNSLGKPIAVAPIPNQGLGIAINDRLKRASAPKTE